MAEKFTQIRQAAQSKLVGRPQPAEKFSDLPTIKLMPAETDRGKPLMQVLKERKSERSYADQDFTLQDLSNLLWAADGITRENGRRTAPSARNLQEFTIYVIVKNGIYSYDPANNELLSIAAGDFRKHAGLDAYVATAPVNLIYVADLAKMNWTTNVNEKMTIANLDVGFIAENVALFCTSEGFASVPRLSIDKDTLAQILKLRPEQKIILGTTVGYRKTND
ncbi:MAG: nitroreductase [Firmicutes bacterium]|nr:nitroreductase [Bacillota bacterium]